MPGRKGLFLVNHLDRISVTRYQSWLIELGAATRQEEENSSGSMVLRAIWLALSEGEYTTATCSEMNQTLPFSVGARHGRVKAAAEQQSRDGLSHLSFVDLRKATWGLWDPLSGG